MTDKKVESINLIRLQQYLPPKRDEKKEENFWTDYMIPAIRKERRDGSRENL